MSGEIGGVCLDGPDAGVDAIDAPVPIDGPPATGWAQLFSSSEYDFANGLATDAAGNVYVVGAFSGNATLAGQAMASGGMIDVFVAKISPAGQRLWVRRFGGTAMDNAWAVATSPGRVYVVGQFVGTVDFGSGPVTSTSTQGDGFLLALDESGATQWLARASGSGAARYRAVVVDAAQDVIVQGDFVGTVNAGGAPLNSTGADDLLVAKYSAAGGHLWSRAFGSLGGETPAGLAVLPGGDVVSGSVFNGTLDAGGGPLTSAGANDAVVVRLASASGAHVWSKRLGGTNGDSPKALVGTSSGFALVGCFAAVADYGAGALTSAGAFDIVIASYDNAGTARWSKSLGGAASECAQNVTAKPSGSLLVAGTFAGTLMAGATSLVSAGTEDVWLIEFAAADGAVLTARRGGGTASDVPTAIVAIGDLFALSGNSLGAADMFGLPLPTGGMMDGFAIQSTQ